MVWEAVHKAAERKIRERGEATYKRFKRVSGLATSLGGFGTFLSKKLLSEVRDGLFGDSIRFFITGGSQIKTSTLAFYNGIGYHIVNGYGMTEIGITSVERSSNKKIANSASIGAPFGYTEYKIDDDGILCVRGKTRASRIMQGGKVTETDFDEWFRTGDLMKCESGRYYFSGREDDLIILEDGENVNPTVVEAAIQTEGAERVCILAVDGGITVIASVQGIFSDVKLNEIYSSLIKKLSDAKLQSGVKRIIFTHEALLRPGEFKLSRKRLAERIERGELKFFDPRRIDEHVSELKSGLEKEIARCFADALEKDECDVGYEADFFLDLDGTSLDYFSLLGIIKSRLGVDITASANVKLSSVKDFVSYIKNDTK
jgi:acyl carrier protein